MRRGTTPTNTINVDQDLRGMTVFVTYAQGSSDPNSWSVVFEKTNDNIDIQEEKILVPLTQEDTLSLSARKKYAYVQVRAIDANGIAIGSNIMTTTVDAILKDGVIEYAP